MKGFGEPVFGQVLVVVGAVAVALAGAPTAIAVAGDAIVVTGGYDWRDAADVLDELFTSRLEEFDKLTHGTFLLSAQKS